MDLAREIPVFLKVHIYLNLFQNTCLWILHMYPMISHFLNVKYSWGYHHSCCLQKLFFPWQELQVANLVWGEGATLGWYIVLSKNHIQNMKKQPTSLTRGINWFSSVHSCCFFCTMPFSCQQILMKRLLFMCPGGSNLWWTVYLQNQKCDKHFFNIPTTLFCLFQVTSIQKTRILFHS